MGKQNVVKHSLRLNLHNEQHRKIQRVFEDLNKEVHKSENQFMIKAMDFYIQSFEEDMEEETQTKKKRYVTVDSLEDIRKGLEDSMKEELIRLLGGAIMGNTSIRETRDRGDAMQEGETAEDGLYATEAANRWG